MTEAKSKVRVRGRLAGLRVLLAEDSWLIADTLCVLLEEEGVCVVGPVSTNAGSIAALQQHAVDFAVVDLSLADAFADALVDELVSRGIPNAVITGYGALPTNADAEAIKVMRKPIDRGVLIELIGRHAVPHREP